MLAEFFRAVRGLSFLLPNCFETEAVSMGLWPLSSAIMSKTVKVAPSLVKCLRPKLREVTTTWKPAIWVTNNISLQMYLDHKCWCYDLLRCYTPWNPRRPRYLCSSFSLEEFHARRTMLCILPLCHYASLGYCQAPYVTYVPTSSTVWYASFSALHSGRNHFSSSVYA